MNDPIATPTPSAYGGDAEDEVHIEAWLIGLCVALLWFLGSKIHKHIIVKHKPGVGDADADITDISDSVRAVEKLLEYSFKNKRLLEEALTHSSCTESASFQRLEWLGDSALGLAVSNFVFSAYPDLKPGPLSLLRSANTCTEKLARVAVRHRFHLFLEHNATALDEKMKEFALAVQKEDDTVVHGGEVMKAPKVLADIVESVAGAVYVDCKLDLQVFWAIFRRLLEPIVDPEILRKQPHPVSFLTELCQKDGRKVDFKYREEAKDFLVYVDGELIASASSENKDNAKLQAARAALEKLCLCESNSKMDVDYSCIHGTTEIEGAKNNLYALCGKKKWPKPYYGIVKESGPFHERRYVCSVEIKTVKNVSEITRIEGDKKKRVRDAENSAASFMIRRLQELQYIN